MNADLTIIRTHNLADGQEIVLLQKGNLFGVARRSWSRNQWTDGASTSGTRQFASPAGSLVALETILTHGPRTWAESAFEAAIPQEMSDAEVAERDAEEALLNAALVATR